MNHSTQPRRDVANALAVLAIQTGSIVLLWRHNTLLLLAILLEPLAALRQWHDRRDRCFFVVLLVLAPLAESVFCACWGVALRERHGPGNPCQGD